MSQRRKAEVAMRDGTRRHLDAAIGSVSLSSVAICICCITSQALLASSHIMQATGGARRVVHGVRLVTAPSAGYDGVFLERLYRQPHGGKRSIRGITHLAGHTSTNTRGNVQRACPSPLAYSVQPKSLPASTAGTATARRSRFGSSAFGPEPASEQRLHLPLSQNFVSLSPQTRAAKKGAAVDTPSAAGLSFLVRKVPRRDSSNEGGRGFTTASKASNAGVELASEVIPSRVLGPVSRFTVCLLHGLLGSRRNLRTLGSCLASPRVVAWDLRNHGESPWLERMSLDDLAHDVLHNLYARGSMLQPQYSPESTASCRQELPLSLKLQKSAEKSDVEVVLVGHSLGGLVAMRAATLAASCEDHRSPASRPPVHIAGIVALDIAPIDYTSTSEQQRLRAHHEMTGVPSTEDIVRLLADLPMHLFENRKQLENALRTGTSPPLPPEIVSWLMTGVRQHAEGDPEERPRRPATAAAAADDPPRLRRSIMHPTNVGSDIRHARGSQARVFGWQMNIYAIRRMLVLKQLGWRFGGCSLAGETEHVSPLMCGEPSQSHPWQPEGKSPEPYATQTAYARSESNGTEGIQQRASRWPQVLQGGLYRGPALFLKGGKSPYIDLERHWAETLKLFPNAKYEIVPGAGHWLHVDRPHLTAEYINNFLVTI